MNCSLLNPRLRSEVSNELVVIHLFLFLGFRDDVIERQLAHTDSNKVRAVYNHAEHLGDRIDMMQQWSDYLDKLKVTK